MKIQEQLAVLDQKLDTFMTKSLNELAQALAATKSAQVVHSPASPTSLHSGSRPGRQMYAVVCFECGKDTEIPFKPSGDRPVFCKECFSKRRGVQGPKPGDSKPQGFSLAAPSEPASSASVPAAKKKAVGQKKSAVKKKTVVKKSAKRK
ncbi:MAG: hypothetical protein JNN05_03775 [Candidatus Omnitrophica bacterium]|nr:hypothetical protein [Candidatus Omnitrophota bacterium]